MRRGITRDTLKVGTKIIVDGYQSKDGSRRANGRDLTLLTGERLFLGSQDTGAPYEVQRPGVDTEQDESGHGTGLVGTRNKISNLRRVRCAPQL